MNCSAPLPQDSILCGYCGSRNDVDIKDINQERGDDPPSGRVCPRCDIQLLPVCLDVKGSGGRAERCESCMGLFFAPGELEKFLDAVVGKVYSINRKLLENLRADKRGDDAAPFYINCPDCGKIMNRVNFGRSSGVMADRCREHGIWLDGGELRRLAEWMKAGGELLQKEREGERMKESLRALERERKRGESAP